MQNDPLDQVQDVRQGLLKKGWSQEKLANNMRIDVKSVQNWVNSSKRTIPHPETLKVLCDLLEIDLEALLNNPPLEKERSIDHITSEAPTAALPITPAEGISKIPLEQPEQKQPFVIKHKRPLMIVSTILLCVVFMGLVAYTTTRGPGTISIPTKKQHITSMPDVNITPMHLAKIAPTYVDTLTGPGYLNWTSPQGYENERLCRFMTGLEAIVRSTWPLAICFEQAVQLREPYAIQVDMTYPRDGNNAQPHGGGIALGVSDPSDNASMYRFRIATDTTYDTYVISTDPAHKGRLDPCPSLTDPTAQSTLHNDYNDPTSSTIKQETGQTDTITIVVVGHFITLYVNNHKLETVCDTTPTSGLIGLFAASPFNHEVTEATFSNLKIWTKF